MGNETLMNLRPKTVYEKLLWERAYNVALSTKIKELLEEKQKVEVELTETKRDMKKSQIGQILLKHKKLKEQTQQKDIKLAKLKKKNAELMESIVRVQTTGSIKKEKVLNNSNAAEESSSTTEELDLFSPPT